MWNINQNLKKIRERDSLKHLYKNELNRACFAHDATYSDSKDLGNRTDLEKILKDRAYRIARNRKDEGYERALASMVYKFFDQE